LGVIGAYISTYLTRLNQPADGVQTRAQFDAGLSIQAIGSFTGFSALYYYRHN
jgi:hypothetical protein